MKYNTRPVLCTSLLLLTMFNSYSQSDSLSDMSLKDLLNIKVTTASKTLQEIDLAPATVIVITKEQIQTRGYQSLQDVLLDLPDVKVDDKIYSGSRNSVVIRGVQGQQNFFILLDGIKVSSPTNEALPIMENYPVYLAEQIEILYGPASALYGADAVTGVINIITQKLPSEKGFVANANTMVGMYGYTNSNLYITKRLGEHSDIAVAGQYCYDSQPDLSKIYKDDTMLSVAHYKEGTFNTIFGPMTPAKPVTPQYQAPTSAYNLYGVLHLDKFTFSLFSNYTRLPNAYGNNTHNAVYNKDVYMEQTVSVLSTSYRRTLGRVTSTSILTASRYNLDPSSNYRNQYSGMMPVYKYSNCLSIKAEEQIDYTVSRKVNLTGGMSYEKISTIPQSADLEKPVDDKANIEGSIAGTTSYYRPEGLPAPFYHILYDNIGGYLQTQYVPYQKISLTLGARYDYNTRYGKTFNPRLGVVYKASPTTNIKALYGSAFLAPPPSTAYVTYGAFETQDSGKTYSAPFLHLPNPELGPVRSQNVEVSVNKYLTRNLMLTADAYYTHLTGLFNFADDNQTTRLYNNSFNGIPVGYVEVFVNDGEQENYGGSIQLNLKHSISNAFLNSYLSFSYVEGRRSGGNSLPGGIQYRSEVSFIAPVMFRIGTDIHSGKFSCSPRLLIMGKQKLPGISDTTGSLIRLQEIKGYALLNIALRYEFSKRIAVFANVTNALNQRYRVVGFNMDLNKKQTDVLHGQPADPIRVMGGINFNFSK